MQFSTPLLINYEFSDNHYVKSILRDHSDSAIKSKMSSDIGIRNLYLIVILMMHDYLCSLQEQSFSEVS